MAHHGMFPANTPDDDEQLRLTKALRERFAEEAQSLGLGATRAFPQGVVNDLDEGEIQFAIKGDREREKVFINFGKSIDFIGMTPRQAVEMAQLLIHHARASAKTKPLSIVLH